MTSFISSTIFLYKTFFLIIKWIHICYKNFGKYKCFQDCCFQLLKRVVRGLGRTMDNYYYFFRPTYQLWPYSRFSQSNSEEGNVLKGPSCPYWTPPRPRSGRSPLRVQVYVSCLLGPDTMDKGPAWSLEERDRISFSSSRQSVLG